MNEILSAFLSIFGMALLAGAFMGVQLLARRMGIHNHIDDNGRCCGACANKDQCERKQEHGG